MVSAECYQIETRKTERRGEAPGKRAKKGGKMRQIVFHQWVMQKTHHPRFWFASPILHVSSMRLGFQNNLPRGTAYYRLLPRITAFCRVFRKWGTLECRWAGWSAFRTGRKPDGGSPLLGIARHCSASLAFWWRAPRLREDASASAKAMADKMAGASGGQGQQGRQGRKRCQWLAWLIPHAGRLRARVGSRWLALARAFLLQIKVRVKKAGGTQIHQTPRAQDKHRTPNRLYRNVGGTLRPLTPSRFPDGGEEKDTVRLIPASRKALVRFWFGWFA